MQKHFYKLKQLSDPEFTHYIETPPSSFRRFLSPKVTNGISFFEEVKTTNTKSRALLNLGDAFYYIDPKIIAVKKDGDWEIWYEPKIVAYSSSETIGTPSIIELLPANFCLFRSYPFIKSYTSNHLTISDNDLLFNIDYEEIHGEAQIEQYKESLKEFQW